MPYLTFNDTNIYYEVHGKGAPLLYIHGWNSSTIGFKENVLPKINNERMTILLDLPGFGKSEFSRISYKDFSHLLIKLLSKLSINSLEIVGFCLGGSFALDFALRYPKRVSKVYLLETTIDFPLVLKPLLVPLLGRKILCLGLFNSVGIWFVFSYLLQRKFPYKKTFLKGFARNNIDISLYYLSLVYNYGKIDHYRRLSELPQTNLVLINGANSPYYVKKTTKNLLKITKKIILYTIDGARHFIIEEKPTLLVNILVKTENECQ